jgi:hypothetical protein
MTIPGQLPASWGPHRLVTIGNAARSNVVLGGVAAQSYGLLSDRAGWSPRGSQQRLPLIAMPVIQRLRGDLRQKLSHYLGEKRRKAICLRAFTKSTTEPGPESMPSVSLSRCYLSPATFSFVWPHGDPSHPTSSLLRPPPGSPYASQAFPRFPGRGPASPAGPHLRMRSVPLVHPLPPHHLKTTFPRRQWELRLAK